MLSVIIMDLGGCEHLFYGLPRTVSGGIPFSFDEILEFVPSIKMTMPQNILNLKFFFSVHKFWGWSKVIGSSLFRFVIGGQQ